MSLHIPLHRSTPAILVMVALASAVVVAAGAGRFDAPTPPPPELSAAPIADLPKPDARPATQTVTLTVEVRDLSTDALMPDVGLELRSLASETRPSATTDASGTARFSMPAGTRYLYLTAALDVASGQAYDLKIGEQGRQVTGRLAIPTAGGWMVRKASIEPRASKGAMSYVSEGSILLIPGTRKAEAERQDPSSGAGIRDARGGGQTRGPRAREAGDGGHDTAAPLEPG